MNSATTVAVATREQPSVQRLIDERLAGASVLVIQDGIQRCVEFSQAPLKTSAPESMDQTRSGTRLECRFYEAARIPQGAICRVSLTADSSPELILTIENALREHLFDFAMSFDSEAVLHDLADAPNEGYVVSDQRGHFLEFRTDHYCAQGFMREER